MAHLIRVIGPTEPTAATASTPPPADGSRQTRQRLPLQQAVQKVLQEELVIDDVWSSSRNGQLFQVEFQVVGSEQAENVLDKLTLINVGKIENSSIMVIEPETYIFNRKKKKKKRPLSQPALQQFVRSLKSRLSVAQVYNEMLERGKFDMNYLCFLLCASLIANIGLVTNSGGVVVASMLLSPFMDPIMCILFGWTLREKRMFFKGVRNTSFTLLICVLLGFSFGYCAHWVSYFEGVTPYPTIEMRQRGQARSLLPSVLVATISGISVAFATLSKRESALIGNAISLSLLPPAVNSGQLLLLATMAGSQKSITKHLDGNNQTTVTCNYKWIRNYEFYYYDDPCDAAIEFTLLCVMSLLLVMVNIALILITGYSVNKLKNLAPRSFTDETARRFYEEDLPQVRGNIQLHQLNPDELANTAYKEFLQLHEVDPEAQEFDRDESIQIVNEYCAVMTGVGKDPHLMSVSAQSGQTEHGFLKEFLHQSQRIASQVVTQRQSDSVLYLRKNQGTSGADNIAGQANGTRQETNEPGPSTRPSRANKLARSQTQREVPPQKPYLNKNAMINRWLQLERLVEADFDTSAMLQLMGSGQTSISEYLSVNSEELFDVQENSTIPATSTPKRTTPDQTLEDQGQQ